MQRIMLKRPSILLQLIIVYGVGLILGVTSVWLPPYFLLIGVAGVIYLVIAWSWPEIALLGILLFASTVFDIYAYPSIPIGVGNLIISDILIFVLIGIIFLRVIVRTSTFIHTPLDFPLLAFYITAILSTVIAIFNSSITFNQSLGEVRIVNFFLTFFIVTNLVRNEKQLRRMFNGIIFLALLVALAMIVQYILGPSVPILPGRVETLGTAGMISYGVARILPPGQSLVMLAFVCLVVQMLFDKRPFRFVVYLIQLGIIGLAVLLTFNRSFWTAIVLSLLLVSLWVSFRDKVTYAKIVLWVVLVGVVVLTPFLSIEDSMVEKLMNGVMVRMSTLFNNDIAQESSLQYRYVENEYAYPQIASHPLIGLGLGANYRPLDRRIDFGPADSILRSYIHNGHLWVILKTGLLGYLFLMWFFFLFVKRGLQSWKQIPDPLLKGIILSFIAMIPGLLLASTVDPIFKQSFWTPVIGIMLGMSEVILRMTNKRFTASQILEELN